MKAAGLVLLLPVAALAGELASPAVPDVEASVRAMLEKATRQERVDTVPAPPEQDPASALPADPAPGSAPPVPAPSTPAPQAPASTHVPVPVKTITIRDLDGIRGIADELDAARQQAPQNR